MFINASPNALRSGEVALHGKPLATGIARGKAYLLKRVDLQQFQKDKRIADFVSSELARLDLAVSRSKDQISRIMSNGRHGALDQSYPIFEAALRLLNDPAFVSSIKETIERTSLYSESVLAEEIARLRDKAFGCADEFTVKGLITMQDLYYRLLYNMLPPAEDRVSSLMKMPAGSILVTDRLTPVEMAVTPMDKVAGLIIEENAQYSHSSIMARSLGVPVIMDFPGIGSLLDESTARSADGVAMHLLCNASNLADVLLALSLGITEIGLFRSEMRYLANTVLPSDKQEAAYYTGLFGVEGIGSMTVRLLDIGGDKLPVYLQTAKETDPQLGCRGIRFLLSRPDLMKKQLRAILAARGAFRVRLLLPKVDFVCLGTNDLIQYLFAVNRDQAELQKYNRFTHPAFLQMLGKVISACENHGTNLTVCGEMASDPLGSRLLAALGATNFSIQPDALHHVRHALLKLNVASLRTVLPTLFALESADEVEQKIQALGM